MEKEPLSLAAHSTCTKQTAFEMCFKEMCFKEMKFHARQAMGHALPATLRPMSPRAVLRSSSEVGRGHIHSGHSARLQSHTQPRLLHPTPTVPLESPKRDRARGGLDSHEQGVGAFRRGRLWIWRTSTPRDHPRRTRVCGMIVRL